VAPGRTFSEYPACRPYRCTPLTSLFQMTDNVNLKFPKSYYKIVVETNSSGFTMSSDVLTCSLLRTLAASKPASKLLELGTGTGLSTSWILDGMDINSTLTSIDNDAIFLEIAKNKLGSDTRLNLIHTDGGKWIEENKTKKFDYIFADTWHGKYLLLDEALNMLNKGGLYIIDDMLPQPNWPDGHSDNAAKLIAELEGKEDLILTKQVWATGIIVAVKK
jgi:predicted O-methyltransferase YrrM